MASWFKRLLGKPKDLQDPELFKHIALMPFLAWVGLGADGLSSSAYGPEEGFRALVGREYLAIFLAIASAATVFVISYTYTRIIEAFPSGGGGYLVASKMLGQHAGVVSGSALVVDYILTISISIASGAAAVFAFLPESLQRFKLLVAVAAIVAMVIMNLRGVKESVRVLTPIFIVFLITHALVIVAVIAQHLGEIDDVSRQVKTGLSKDLADPAFGLGGVLLLFARAYSMGGGTYTGIEAVSNGLQIMREPRVETAKRTMTYMAVSLAFAAAGIILSYLLLGIHPSPDEPMNALMVKKFASGWHIGGFDAGHVFVVITLFSEAALLFVAAQAGFIDGPRVMANMAVDSWLPHALAALSERLTMRNGVYLLGGAALAVLLYTGGDVHTLAVMYSINVFVTFSLSNLGMVRHWASRQHRRAPGWKQHLAVHLIGLTLCLAILVITILERFTHGGWITLLITGALVGFAYWVKAHYKLVGKRIAALNVEMMKEIGADTIPPAPHPAPEEMIPEKPTAVLLASSFGGIGVQTLRRIEQIFPGQFQQAVFVSVGVIDSGTFKGADEIEALEENVKESGQRYAEFAREKLGWAASCEVSIGTEAVASLEDLCRDVYLRFPRSVFFAGKLIFREPTWWQRLLHNETAEAVQRRLLFDGLPMVILPVRVLK